MPTLSPELVNLLDQIHRDQTDRTLKLVTADLAEESGYPRLGDLLRHLAGERFHDQNILSTGSRLYGEVRENSDWDWVVWMNWNEQIWFKMACDPKSDYKPKHEYPASEMESGLSGSSRFGPVNVIWVEHEPQMRCWLEGTHLLLAESGLHGPRTRDRAVEVFTGLRRKYLRASPEPVPYEPDHYDYGGYE